MSERAGGAERFAPYILIGPAFLATIGILAPFAISLWWSLSNYKLTRPNYRLIGLDNYLELLKSPDFWNSTLVTFKYALGAVSVELGLGLALALLLNRETLASRILRPLLILPLVIAPVIGTLMWKLMMSPEFGVANYMLSFFGQRYFPWASVTQWALFSVVLIDAWMFSPFIALLLLAGLRSLPAPPFEAANVDGASPWFVFRRLTLPMLTPFIYIAMVFRLIDSLKAFDIPFALTKGGPGEALMTYQIRGFNEVFTFLNIAKGSAYMLINWLIVYIICFLLVGRLEKAKSRLR